MNGQLLAVQHDGTTEWIDNRYEEIKRAMNEVTIDFVATTNLGCFVDDNGMIDAQPLNWIAAIMMFQPLYGPVVFAAADPDDEGNTLPADDKVYDAVEHLAAIIRHIRGVADRMGQKLDVYADDSTLPPPLIVGLTQDWTFGDPLPTEPAPVCPACGAEATWEGTAWITEHKLDCAWMRDPESVPY